ncbi:MAG: MerR family transcriptional regulator [Acidimicrobiales bacterium]
MAERAHLSIGEVLALLQQEFPDVTISKIRFLESQGLLDPERTPSGYRKFYDDDIERLRWILQQQRDHFLPLRVIKERLEKHRRELAARDGSVAAGTSEAAGDAGTPDEEPADTEAARAALAEALARRTAVRQAGEAARRGLLDPGDSDLSLTREELAAASDLPDADIERLVSFGLLVGRPFGREVVFDGDALVVARLAAAFLRHGLEPRHLRMFKVAAEREAGVYEQLVAPTVRQRNAGSRQRATARLEELAALGQDLQAALLRQALRDLTG